MFCPKGKKAQTDEKTKGRASGVEGKKTHFPKSPGGERPKTNQTGGYTPQAGSRTPIVGRGGCWSQESHRDQGGRVNRQPNQKDLVTGFKWGGSKHKRRFLKRWPRPTE